jgi:hypothetical protein
LAEINPKEGKGRIRKSEIEIIENNTRNEIEKT